MIESIHTYRKTPIVLTGRWFVKSKDTLLVEIIEDRGWFLPKSKRFIDSYYVGEIQTCDKK